MDNTLHTSYFIEDNLGYFSLIKKEIHKKAEAIGFTGRRLGEIDILISEMASNLMKHTGKGGELLVKCIGTTTNPGIEMVSIDSGLGMKDAFLMMKDGVSTTKTLGQGLGAIKRLSDFFEIFSIEGWGTVLLSRVYLNPSTWYIKPPEISLGTMMVAKPGENVSGDGWIAVTNKNSIKILVGDGLGHGEHAHFAITTACDVFQNTREENPCEIIRELNNGLKKTRGIVGTVLVFDFKEKCWWTCGVGNISTRVYNFEGVKARIPYNGIIGLTLPKTMTPQLIKAENNQTLILCSDGILTKWDLARYPGILKHDPTIIASVLYKDFGRRTDDMLSVVIKTALLK